MRAFSNSGLTRSEGYKLTTPDTNNRLVIGGQ